MATKSKTKVTVKKATEKKASAKKGEKKERVEIMTPRGRFSFPHLHTPKEGLNGKDFYSSDLLIDKKDWAKDPFAKKLKEAVVHVAKANGLGSDLDEFKHPLVDMESLEDCPEGFDKFIKISAKTDAEYGAPVIIGPRKSDDGKFKELSESQVKKIKGGDYGRMKVVVSYYDAAGNEGVTFYLSLVQYAEEGESFGGGRSATLEDVDEMEVTEETPEDDSSDEQEEEIEEEETEDDSEESEEEDEEEEDEKPSKKSSKKDNKVEKKSGKKGFSF